VTNTEQQIADLALKAHRANNQFEVCRSIAEDAQNVAVSVTADQVLEIIKEPILRDILILKVTPVRNITRRP
jgi:hypothetical protein